MTVLPRLIRLRDTPGYLGMDINRFNQEVRPKLMAIPIGKQGLAFDRYDLDHWVDQYKEHYAQSQQQIKRSTSWEENVTQDYTNVKAPGTSTNGCSVNDFAKAVAQAS